MIACMSPPINSYFSLLRLSVMLPFSFWNSSRVRIPSSLKLCIIFSCWRYCWRELTFYPGEIPSRGKEDDLGGLGDGFFSACTTATAPPAKLSATLPLSLSCPLLYIYWWGFVHFIPSWVLDYSSPPFVRLFHHYPFLFCRFLTVLGNKLQPSHHNSISSPEWKWEY